MERDQGHSDSENELRPHPIQGVLYEPQNGRPDQGAHRHQHHHLGQPQQGRQGLRDEPSPDDEAEVPEYLLGHGTGQYIEPGLSAGPPQT